MKKKDLRKTITKNVEEQKNIIENTNSISYAAREILGTDSTLARTIIKEICNEQGWNIPTWYNRARYCLNCGKPIVGGDSRKKFCDSSCAAKYNNKLRKQEKRYCLNCGKEIKRGKFCDNTCYAEYNAKQYIERWKKGEENGLSGKYGIASAVRQYIFEKNENKCEVCGRSYINPYTGLSVLQIHHKDGDCTNNREENLQLLCPTHHAMTENFGSRNPNATRKDNRKRY
jgi:hypothetical protein